MRYLILSVPMSLLVLKENPWPHFVQRLFFLINISFKYYVFSMYLYMLCILAANVMRDDSMYVTFRRARAHTL